MDGHRNLNTQWTSTPTKKKPTPEHPFTALKIMVDKSQISQFSTKKILISEIFKTTKAFFKLACTRGLRI
jgi:hypothetical protein